MTLLLTCEWFELQEGVYGREALTPIGAVEVLGAFNLAAGPHV